MVLPSKGLLRRTSLEMGSVTTVKVVTMNYKGSIEAVRHSFRECGVEDEGKRAGLGAWEQARQSAMQVHGPTASRTPSAIRGVRRLTWPS